MKDRQEESSNGGGGQGKRCKKSVCVGWRVCMRVLLLESSCYCTDLKQEVV